MDISLALGGGGAKGIAHIGVLERLEQHGFRVRAVAGTSAGGIIAAIYAAGFSPAQIIERFTRVDQSSLFGRQADDWPAILGVAGLNRVLHEMLDDCTFAELKIPCALTAVNLDTEEEVVLSKGRVVDAVLATIALPGVFLLNSGKGVTWWIWPADPVPVLPARRLAKNLLAAAVVLSRIPRVPLFRTICVHGDPSAPSQIQP
jgi:NTE family protein